MQREQAKLIGATSVFWIFAGYIAYTQLPKLCARRHVQTAEFMLHEASRRGLLEGLT